MMGTSGYHTLMWARCGWTSFWQEESSLLVDRCGVEASVRRYRIDIPSGLQGEHLYLVSAKKGRSWPDSPYDGGAYLLATSGQVRWPL